MSIELVTVFFLFFLQYLALNFKASLLSITAMSVVTRTAENTAIVSILTVNWCYILGSCPLAPSLCTELYKGLVKSS